MSILHRYRDDFRANMKLALPIMGGQLGQVLVNLADNLMVGRLGAAALASVSLANAVFFVFFVVGMGISFALPPLISEADGAGKYHEIARFFKHSFVVNIGFAIITIGMVTLCMPILYHLGQDPDIIPLAKEYLEITTWSLIPLMVLQTLRCYCDGLSNTLYPMIALLIGNVLNVLLNYGFIFGEWGFPMMGVKGAAIASMIARIAMVLILFWMIKRNIRLAPYISNINFKVFHKNVFKRIISLGVPTSMQMFFEITAFSGAAIIMGMLGKVNQAAHQISINLASTTFLICTGIGMAATIRVGNQLGKRDRAKMRSAGFSAILQVVLIMSITGVLFILFRGYLPTLYIADQEVIQVASLLLIMAAIFQIPDGVQVTALGALRGLQDVNAPTLITFIAYWLVGLPISYITSITLDLGPLGVWAGLILGLTLSAVMLTWRFNQKSKNWISN